MRREPRPLALTIRGSKRVVAHACRVCRVVVRTEREARDCCGKRCRCGTTIRAYQSECLSCTSESAHERIHEREAREMAEAEKVELADYSGAHLSDGDEYFVPASDVDRDDIDAHGLYFEGRRFLWGCTEDRPSMDLAQAIDEDVLQEFHEGAFDMVDMSALARAQTEVDRALAPVVSYYADHSTMVLLPGNEDTGGER